MKPDQPEEQKLNEPPRPTEIQRAEAGPLDELVGHLFSPRGERGLTGFDTGFKAFNWLLGGLTQGLYLLAGPPACGKSSLAKQLADQVAAVNGVPVVYFSFLHSANELHVRTLARLSGVGAREISAGRSDKVLEEQGEWGTVQRVWEKVDQAMREYRGFADRVKIVPADATTGPKEICEIAARIRSEARVRRVLIVIDHVQVIPGGGGRRSADEQNLEICAALRNHAREIDSPILGIWSTSNEAYRSNRTPSLAIFRDSRGVEHVADAVLAMWEDQSASRRLAREGPGHRRVDLLMLKNRFGPLARITCDFNAATCAFSNLNISDEPYDRFDAMQG